MSRKPQHPQAPRKHPLHLPAVEAHGDRAIRNAGWCPECKERIEQCECEPERKPLNFDDDVIDST